MSGDLNRRALRLVVELYAEGTLSEGQCCKKLNMDRVAFRTMCDQFSSQKTANVLSFEGGALQINSDNFGLFGGQGSLSLEEEHLERVTNEEDSAACWRLRLPRSELIAIRDFLSEHVRDE